MHTAKQEVSDLLDRLPEDCSLEDIQYHLLVLQKIQRGLKDIEEGDVHTQEEVEKDDVKMAREVIWSKEATSDLESIAEYIAKDSTFYAAAFIQELIDAGRSLRNFSDRGRMVPELSNPNVRELFVREYRLIYIIEGLRVGILGIIHGKRDLKKLWEKEKR